MLFIIFGILFSITILPILFLFHYLVTPDKIEVDYKNILEKHKKELFWCEVFEPLLRRKDEKYYEWKLKELKRRISLMEAGHKIFGHYENKQNELLVLDKFYEDK